MPSWTRTPIRPAHQQGWGRWWPRLKASSTKKGSTALGDGALAERVMALRGLLDRLEGHWLAELADLDARGAAGAEHGVPAASTAAWLRHRLRMGAGTAAGWCAPPAPCTGVPLTGTEPDRRGHLPGPRPESWPPAPTTSPTTWPPTPNRCWWRRPGGWTLAAAA